MPNKFLGLFATPLEWCNFVDSLISWVRLFSESYLSDIDSIVLFENATPLKQNKKVKIKEHRAG